MQEEMGKEQIFFEAFITSQWVTYSNLCTPKIQQQTLQRV